MGQAMERNDECDIAIMVYNYLIEQRMMQVAETFSQTSPYLPRMRRCARGCMYITQPFRSLQEVVRDYISLNRSMKLLLMKYHKEVKLPHEKTTWEKVMCVVDHFRSKINTESASDWVKTVQNSTETSQSANNLFQPNNTPTQEQYRQDDVVMREQPVADKPDQQQEGPIIYQFTDVPRQMEATSLTSQLDQSQFVYQLGEFMTLPNGESVAEPQTHPNDQTPMVVYVVNNSDQPIETGGETIVQTVENANLQGCSPAMTTMSYQEDVTIAQQVEISTELVESCTPERQEVPSGTFVNLAELSSTESVETETSPEIASAPAMTVMMSEQTVPEGTVPMAISDNNGLLSPEQTNADVAQSEQQALVKPDERSDIHEPGPSLPKLDDLISPKRAIDPIALKEWNRIRSVNRSNFDDYVREVINEEEARKRLEQVIQDKKNREKRLAERRKQSKTIKTVVRPPQSSKSPRASAVKKGVVKPPPKKSSVVTKSANGLDSDTSDFASSMDEEDDDVRKMAQNIKRYRQQQQQKQPQTGGSVKEKPTKEPIGESSSSPLQCRVNMVVGRTPRQTAVKRSLRNRTPSTSPVATPMKRNKQQHLVTKTPATKTAATKTPATKTPVNKTPAAKTQTVTTPRPGTIRQQQAKKQVKNAEPEVTKVPQRTARATAAAKRRSNEAAKDTVKPPPTVTALSRKTPRKQTSVENLSLPLFDDDSDVVSSKGDGALVTTSTKEPSALESTENPTPVEESEAAIYAVLAQLHGDD